MFPILIKYFVYLNLTIIFSIILYLAFSKNKKNESKLDENFTKTYKIKF